MEYLTLLVNKIYPYIIGYVTALGLSSYFINLIYEEVWREISKDFTDDDRDHELHRYYGWAIGSLEIIIYIAAFLQPQPTTAIGIWLAFKVAGRWERSRIEYKKNRNKERLYLHVIYSNFTIGNALSIIYSFIGCGIIQLLQKNNIIDAVLLGSTAIIVSSIFLCYAKRQSKRIKKFNEGLKAKNKEPLAPNI